MAKNIGICFVIFDKDDILYIFGKFESDRLRKSESAKIDKWAPTGWIE